MNSPNAAEEIEQPTEEIAPEAVINGEDDVPGYMDYETFIENGGNPDDFKGKNAYKAEYDRIQENKGLRNDLKDLKETVNAVVQAADEMRIQDQKKYKQELEDKLAEQVKNMETKEALETQKEIDAIESQSPPQVTQINPQVGEFLSQHPILDANSSQFNQEAYDDYEAFHNAEVSKFGGRPTPTQLERAMNQAYKEVQRYHPDLFKSSRNNRNGAPRSTGHNSEQPMKNLKDYKIENTEDPRNQNAATDIYELIKKQNPDTAERFKKRLLQGEANVK